MRDLLAFQDQIDRSFERSFQPIVTMGRRHREEMLRQRSIEEQRAKELEQLGMEMARNGVLDPTLIGNEAETMTALGQFGQHNASVRDFTAPWAERDRQVSDIEGEREFRRDFRNAEWGRDDALRNAEWGRDDALRNAEWDREDVLRNLGLDREDALSEAALGRFDDELRRQAQAVEQIIRSINVLQQKAEEAEANAYDQLILERFGGMTPAQGFEERKRTDRAVAREFRDRRWEQLNFDERNRVLGITPEIIQQAQLSAVLQYQPEMENLQATLRLIDPNLLGRINLDAFFPRRRDPTRTDRASATGGTLEYIRRDNSEQTNPPPPPPSQSVRPIPIRNFSDSFDPASLR